ncbi:hypothetical protein [Paraburkholderia sp. BCC1885]|uniref:hypothetical protein n=1 Tax=Paraburkholderia sp. BCC1885 TaxID=2562669 RepID=UPI001182C764|nr:hypothetical protein [Paraburkholderia sp. BCC1885]
MRHPPASEHDAARPAFPRRCIGLPLAKLMLRLAVTLGVAACSQHDHAADSAQQAAATAPASPNQAASAAAVTLCAAERGVCRFTGTQQVRYGTVSRYVVLTLNGGTPCDNTVFGDPAPGALKSCWIVHPAAAAPVTAAPPPVADRPSARAPEAPPGTTAAAAHRPAITWTACASERGTCAFSGKHDVKYGSDTQYVILTFTGGTPCDNTVFGDPAPGTQKRCWYDSGIAPAPSAQSIIATPGTSTLTCGAPSEPANATPDGATLEADTLGGDGTRIFANGRPFSVALTTRARASDTLAWQILDTWGNVRAAGQFDIASGPQVVSLSCVSTLAGYFAISATLSSAGTGLPMRGTRPAGIATFGVLPDLSSVLPPPAYAHEDLHRFGGQGAAYVTPGQSCCSGDGYRPLYPDLGLRWTNDNRNWYMLEPNGPNTFNAAMYPLAPFFKAGDLMRLIQLDGIPAWASPTHAATHSYLPVSLPAYQSFLNRVGQESGQVRAQRFAHQAHNYYQVTWEPDYNSGLPWKDTDANLVSLYQATWEGIHATDPDAVIMGTTNAAVSSNTEWLQRLAPLGIARYLDGVSIHGYYDIGTSPSHPPERLVGDSDPAQAAQSLPAAMRALRQQIAATLKPGARLFVTETGISYDLGAKYGANYPTPNVLYAQGAVVARTHLILLGEGADVTFLFYATDFPHQIGFGLFFDLADAQGGYGPSAISPKPAAMVTAAMTRIVDGTNTLGSLNGLPPGVYAYAFQQLNGGPVITALWTHNNAVWNTSKGFSSTYQVPYNLQVDAPGSSGQVSVLDVMGNPSNLSYSNGVAALMLSETPIYVISTNAAVARANVTTPAGYVAQ